MLALIYMGTNMAAGNPTSFPGSLFSASLGRWKKDPGCGWSRVKLLYISSISAGRRPVCLLYDLLDVQLFRCFMLLELALLKAHCSLNKTMFY